MEIAKTPRLIAEIGINHLGRFDLATELVKRAASAGVWGIKFQYRNLNSAFAPKRQEIGDEIVSENIRRSYLPPDQIIELAEIARSFGTKVGISFFNTADVEDFQPGCFDFYKIPSAEFVNFPLVSRLLEFERDLLVSVGMQTENTIMDFAKQFSSTRSIVLLHCVSNYPTSSRNAHLGYIQWLKENYEFRVGYSSHDDDWLTVLHSLQYQPEYVERHITLSRNLEGTDQSSSSTVEEFELLARHCREVVAITSGYGPRVLNQGEKINRQNLGRGYYARRKIDRGVQIRDEDFDYRAPLVGLDRLEIQGFRGKTTSRDISQGEPLSLRHFVNGPDGCSGKALKWACVNNVGLPVRLHDYAEIAKTFELGRYELHLSFGELEKIDEHLFSLAGEIRAIHLPDYCDADHLLDPFSSNMAVKDKSLSIMRRIRDLAEDFSSQSKKPVVVVCSFSNDSIGLEEFYEETQRLFDELSTPGVILSIQWLPPVAWYFGGSVNINRVNSKQDALYLSGSKIPVTMDIAHLSLCENSGMLEGFEVLQLLGKNIVHFHLSGASGHDGEGVDFDPSDSRQNRLISETLRLATHGNQTVILETWQGHLDGFNGFSRSIEYLHETMEATND